MADKKVRVVNSGADITVSIVNSGADFTGTEVQSGEDLKVRIVHSGCDKKNEMGSFLIFLKDKLNIQFILFLTQNV